MTENPIKHALHAIHTMDHSKEAALIRLQRAGILTKSGKMTALYRRCIAAQTAKNEQHKSMLFLRNDVMG